MFIEDLLWRLTYYEIAIAALFVMLALREEYKIWTIRRRARLEKGFDPADALEFARLWDAWRKASTEDRVFTKQQDASDATIKEVWVL
jgi:hypothetical protein